MLEDMVEDGDTSGPQTIQLDHDKIAAVLNEDRNFSISCELGLRYPTLKAMINRADLNLRISVSLSYVNRISWYIFGIYNEYVAIMIDINCI